MHVTVIGRSFESCQFNEIEMIKSNESCQNNCMMFLTIGLMLIGLMVLHEFTVIVSYKACLIQIVTVVPPHSELGANHF